LRQDTWFVRDGVVFCNRIECFNGERGTAAAQLMHEGFESESVKMIQGLRWWLPRDANIDLLTRQLDRREYPRLAE
jgi:hypothetical protein